MSNLNTVSLTQEDIQANAHGILSRAQVYVLYQRRLLFIVATLGIVGILASLLILIFLKLRFPSFANRGELFLWIPIGLLWLWLLRLSPIRWFSINNDLREGKVAHVEGRVICRWRNTLGFIQVPQYEIRVADQVFTLSSREFFQFTNQGSYRITFAPQSQVFLGAVSVTELPGPEAKHVAMDEPVENSSSSLTPRELEILRRMADGLSNKEIANQLSLSVNTIKMYASQIYQKLGVSRRTEAIALARNWKII